MSKEIYISSTPHETRLAIVEDEALTEIYYERENEYTLAGSIYNGRVTRVLPGMQSSFVDIGLERDAFLYITDFMEETPDADEFDTTPAGDRAPRLPRPNGGERPDEPAVRAESAGRSSDRGDRGGRGRRGGRDRDRNPDRQPGSDAAPRQPGFDRTASDRDRSDAPRAAGAADPGAAAPRDVTDSSEVGEGAPGADGSRRWRGRRGRRRGRATTGQPGDPAQENTAPANSESPAYPEDEPSFERESYMEIDAAAPASDVPVSRIENAPRNDRSGDRARRDQNRGDQGRGAPRHDGQRSDSPRRPDQRSPRGFTPSRDLYGVDSGETRGTGPIANAYPDDFSGSSAEPIILPGESLSKYRKGEEQAAATPAPTTVHATPVTLAPPANLYTIAEGWDGGATLPGETLSRRRPVESRTESRHDSRHEARTGPPGDFEREPRRGRDARTETRRESRSEFRNSPPPADQPATPAGSQPSHAPSAEIVREPAAFSTSATAPEAAPGVAPEAAAAFAPEPTPHVEVDYEPEDASASHRVDPMPPSEYRQSAPTLEPPAQFIEQVSAPFAETSPVVEAEPIPQVPVAVAHDITAISATGEMFSEPVEVLPDVTSHPAPIETPEPASPIRHEGAILTHDADAEFVAPATGGFAPGSGLLDEEILDEEDSEGTTLHASSIEEIDDLEEETLEGAADLGSMLREMSIDHITRTLPEVEDEDDTEEDDLEEDDLEEDEEEEEDEEDEDDQEGYQLDDPARSDQAGQSEGDLHEQAARTGNAAEAEFFEQQFGQPSQDNRSEQQSASAPSPGRDPNRDSDRRGGRRGRDGRRGHSDRSDHGGDRNRGGRPGHSNGHGRHSMQSTNLPAISDLLKPGQEILVQIAKEPIAKKGARITSHIALPGRFLVFMPTVNHTGVSRKIESDGERRRLKDILLSEKGEATGGFIVRTAAEGASEEELRSDLRFLLNLWADIKARSESSKSPALIYHDLNLVERILRDQVTDNFSAIWVDTEDAYERVLRFLQRFQPSLIRRVKLYLKDTPLFEQFGITEEINKALRSKVWLKSGGSIVINQTEALVAIDINTGKFVGKTARLEDTIVKTNLDAIPEIVRQIRLRDLGGIIIIDFIDMDERKNRNRVMAALEDELKSDRAPSKVLQFNDFGLVAITRKRVKQSLERTLSTTCAVCTGTGMVKSPVTVCNDIYIEMRKMHKHLDRGDVMLRVHPEVVKQLKSSGAKWLQEMEEMAGKTILVKSDPSLHPEQFDIH
jgi:ribonuclease E